MLRRQAMRLQPRRIKRLLLCRTVCCKGTIETVMANYPKKKPRKLFATMVELLPPPLKLALYDPDQHSAKITFRVQDLGTATYKPVFQRIESAIKEIRGENPGVEIALESDPIRRWKNLYQIVSDLAMSLGFRYTGR